MVKSPLLQTEFAELSKRLEAPPALPGQEFEFNREPEAVASPKKPAGTVKKN